ncbi:putative non-LTR retroelement reverse transcriptase [Trifolium medium]|uniref:Putative non-LTR retroelement reverse transcriptase n=1 Tax=Trifolium medium TaxID=97028 RepID=A0A392M436_9FABA|nr:putative non-LTR retroelement reverse transcriptase [Trifolium medium]
MTVSLGSDVIPWYASIWWKDICSMGTNLNLNWFAQQVVRKVGNGANTTFWYDKWVGDMVLKDKFPRLFTISNRKEAMVKDLVMEADGTLSWNFSWRRHLFAWEVALQNELMVVLNEFRLTNENDVWGWEPEKRGIFTVYSTYRFLVN